MTNIDAIREDILKRLSTQRFGDISRFIELRMEKSLMSYLHDLSLCSSELASRDELKVLKGMNK